MMRGWDGRCLQLDPRDDEFPKAIVYFQKQLLDRNKLLSKGYNLNFATFEVLDDAVRKLQPDFIWSKFPSGLYIIMVFYPKPFIQALLREKGMDHNRSSANYLTLDYLSIYDTVKKQISSFIEEDGLDFIPEIVHSGLGLGYNNDTGEAKNILDGTPITHVEAIFERFVDRAMIDVSLYLRKAYPNLHFSSLTRLCGLRMSKEELFADMETGKLKEVPNGEKGISRKLRSIHSGLYPQSDIVVADDPLAEIAARTWIDEAKNLNREELSHMTYNEWLGELKIYQVRSFQGHQGAQWSLSFKYK